MTPLVVYSVKRQSSNPWFERQPPWLWVYTWRKVCALCLTRPANQWGYCPQCDSDLHKDTSC